MSDKMQITSSSIVKERIAEAMGLDQPSALDLVSRGNYASEESYLDAAVKAELERSSPEYQATRRKLMAEYRERQEVAERKAQAEQYREIRAKVQLAPVDVREIDAEATAAAQRDLAAGRIRASEMGATISKYASELTEKRKDAIAADMQMNAMLRAATGR